MPVKICVERGGVWLLGRQRVVASVGVADGCAGDVRGGYLRQRDTTELSDVVMEGKLVSIGLALWELQE